MEPSVIADLGSLKKSPQLNKNFSPLVFPNLKVYFHFHPTKNKNLLFFNSLKVKAAFNEQTRSYEIWTNSQCKKSQEVFICYGPHDNQRLLLEYGFVAMDNPHSSVYVSPGGIY